MKLFWFIISLIFIGSVVGFLFWFRLQLNPIQSESVPTTFIVYQGQSATDILISLQEAKLIRSPLVGKLYLLWTKSQTKIRPGSYTLSPHQNLSTIFALLMSGPKSVWVTLPEGWRREQMADRLKSTVTDFDVDGYLAQSATLEGQLFPDTYLLPPDVTPGRMIELQTAALFKKTNLDLTTHYPLPSTSGQITLTGPEVLILASLVERESRSDTDRPIIAGILLNRLSADWPLQVDATVQYAQDPINGKYWSPVTNTRFISPFNTYLHTGLPPKPIANPGAKAISAVLLPQTTAYWYYIHEPNGTPHYARTLAEHNLNIDKYLRP